MNEQRLTMLKQLLEEIPNDPFTLYAIATEYAKEDPLKALECYESLIENHPDYVPTYYHLAGLYRHLDQPEKARKTYETGIEKAQKNHDTLALRELRNAFDEFMMD